MVSLPKIKIGRSTKRSFFDMSHDVNTTCDFGFCQPTLMQDLIPNTRFDLSTRGFVRLSPMPVPTFGRMKVKQITRCIDLKDVFTDFKHFIAKRKILNNGMSMPNTLTECDWINLSSIFSFMQCIQHDNVFNGGTSYSDYENVDANDILFRLSLHTNGPLKEGQETTPVGSLGGYFYNVFDSFDGTPGMGNTAYNQLAAMFDNDETLNTFSLFGNWISYKDGLRSSQDDYVDFNETPTAPLRSSLLQWLTNNQDVHSFVQYKVESEALGSYDQYYLTSGGINLPGNIKHIFDSPMTLDNADFIVDFPDINLNYNLITANGEVQQKSITAAKVGIHLTPAGRRIFKILYAIGIDTSTKDFEIPLYKLFAYYKAWFDTFNVGRTRSWEMTYCHALIDRFHEHPTIPFQVLLNTYMPDDYELFYSPVKSFIAFLRELPRCCYVLDADPYTCCTQNPLLDTARESMAQSIVKLPSVVNSSVAGYAYNQVQPSGLGVYGEVSGNNTLNALTVKALQMTLPFLNKGSQLSNKINEILAVKFGVKLPPTDFVGEQEFSISVDDVFSTAETAEGTLGEYAGKAVGGIGSKDNPAKKFTYETGEDTFSFLVQFTCVVPYGGYSQSVPKHAVKVNDWYMSEYDSLGMEPVSYSQVMGRIYSTKYIEGNQKLFGFRPRFMCYKYHDNLANGGFAFRSQLGYFMPYMLDRYFTPADVEVYKDASSQYPGTSYVRENQSVKLTPSEELRYIGLTESYGNYDRIFIDNTGQSDNFILTLYQDFNIYSPMKPISESYDAYDPERDDDTVKTKIA